MVDKARRIALATFLRARRTRARPCDFGMEVDSRRRAQGLRREEVALSAGISVAWYTSLEQGRQFGVSESTLTSLARALQLNADERRYMFRLAGVDPGMPEHDTAVGSGYATMLLHAFGQTPAYIYDYMWNLCSWNHAAEIVYGLSELAIPDRNGLVYMFLNPRAPRLIVNWESEARRMLARFRLSVGPRLGDPAIDQLVARLNKESEQFAAWWPVSDDVMAERPQRKELTHPVAGSLVFEYFTCYVCGNESFRIVVHTPLDEANTQLKLRELVQASDRGRDGGGTSMMSAGERYSLPSAVPRVGLAPDRVGARDSARSLHGVNSAPRPHLAARTFAPRDAAGKRSTRK